MDCLITPRNVDVLCRVCLTSSKNLVHLATNEKNANSEKCSIHEILELVTSTRVVINDKIFPSKICQMCLSFLKIAYEFQVQFKNSQNFIKRVLKETPTDQCSNEPQSEIFLDNTVQQVKPTAAVELIYGKNKFDLKDVVVVEEEKEEDISFDGFLKNLGCEISAKFVGENTEPRLSHKQLLYDGDVKASNIEKRQKNLMTEQPKFRRKFMQKNLDISRLKVNKYPEDYKIVIEDTETNKIVKTLFECDTCKKIFTSKNDLETHIDLKHCGREFLICDKCGHMAQTRSQLYHHLQKHKGKQFQCEYCDKRYNTISHLKVHLEVHKNERRYLCNVCGKNFNYRISLTYHLRLHSEKKFVCNICGLKYRMPNTLKRHIRTHTKDKPYRCNYCEKSFPSRGEQLQHQMLHTGERPYHCEYCGKGFIKSVNLHSHYLSHPGPHQCTVCQKTFLDVKFLKLHFRRFHKDYEIIEIVES